MTRFRSLLLSAAIVAGSSILWAQAPAQSKPAAADDEFLKGAYLAGTEGLTVPKATRMVKPKYTPDAMRAKLQGRVVVQAVVLADGTVDRVRVLESLDRTSGLDDAALAAAKQWLFEPGTLKGKPVPVVVEQVLEFKLH